MTTPEAPGPAAPLSAVDDRSAVDDALSMDARIEASQWDPFWLPPWARVVDRPALRYTASDQDQHALNQVTRVRALPGVSLAALVDEVSRAHAGVTSRWLLAPASQLPGLPPLLERAGWSFEHTHHLRVLDTSATVAVPPGVHATPVTDADGLRDCIRVAEAAFSRAPGAIRAERVADELAALDRGRVHRFVARDRETGTPLASAGLNTFPALGVGFLWGGGTHPDHRGRGAYRALVAARLDRARALGCGAVGVYARDTTSDPILAGLGFVRHGTMLTWLRPAAR